MTHNNNGVKGSKATHTYYMMILLSKSIKIGAYNFSSLHKKLMTFTLTL